jgi:hypothetical protein
MKLTVKINEFPLIQAIVTPDEDGNFEFGGQTFQEFPSEIEVDGTTFQLDDVEVLGEAGDKNRDLMGCYVQR